MQSELNESNYWFQFYHYNEQGKTVITITYKRKCIYIHQHKVTFIPFGHQPPLGNKICKKGKFIFYYIA